MSNSRLAAPSAGTRRRCRRGDESGAALVEFALVIGLFAFILYGLISFGMMLAVKQGITNAAAEGARSAVGLTGAAAKTKAQTTVAQRLGWLGSNYNAGDVVVSDPAACVGGSGTCITVKITYPWKARPIVPPAPGLGLMSPTSFGSEATVQIS